MRFIGFFALVVTLISLDSCRKNDNGTPSGSDADIIKDSALLITRDFYLWNDQIPAGFDAGKYAGPPEIMTAIRQYSRVDGFTDPVDRYSFAMTKEEWDNTSSGISSDFGLNVFFREDGDLRVRSVESASPAGLAGVRRGWRITKVNGSSNITTSNTDFLTANIYNSANCTFTFEKPDGSSVDVALNATQYQEHPVYLDTTYTAGSKKVGYLVFNSFLGDTVEVDNEFKRIFQEFKDAGVEALVVDLRYNGGGYVSMQQELADYITPSIANGSVMMKQKFNSNYSALNETDMFTKKGALNIGSLFFIVSDNTASASELLINNLRPYINTKLVGENTYGKPVGFFPLGVGDYYIFPISFITVNSLDQGNYFDGLQVDQAVKDGIDKDWGDVSELRLASVLKYISTGSFSFAPDAGTGLFSTLEQPQLVAANAKLSNVRFRGTVGKTVTGK
jgi:carboxyl-terminal processing protease